MNGIHDLGGRHGFGAVVVEADEPAFHERWEAAVFAMMFACGRCGASGNSDRFRHAIERIDPAAYLEDTYYGRWLGGIETLLVEAGFVDREELSERARARGAAIDARIASRPAATPDAVPLGDEGSCLRTPDAAPAFAVGDAIRTRLATSGGHTRLPDYARGRPGHIVAHRGGWVFPDTNAHGLGEAPTHLYTVAFRGEDLWGADGEADLVVNLDLFEPYLEPCDA